MGNEIEDQDELDEALAKKEREEDELEEGFDGEDEEEGLP